MNCLNCNAHINHKHIMRKENKKLAKTLFFTYCALSLSVLINAVFIVRFL